MCSGIKLVSMPHAPAELETACAGRMSSRRNPNGVKSRARGTSGIAATFAGEQRQRKNRKQRASERATSDLVSAGVACIRSALAET